MRSVRLLRLPLAALLTGVAAGVGGALLTLLLHAVQHLAFGYSGSQPFIIGLEHAPPWRRVVGMATVGAVVGLGWWGLRRPGPVRGVRAAIADPTLPLPVRRTTADALLQVAAVGGGASVGREGAPRQVGALAGGLAAHRLGLGPARRRLLLAAGAGAGLAAVYNVPVSGVLFALIALSAFGGLRAVGLVDVMVVVIACGVATVVAWPVVGNHSVYAVPPLSVDLGLLSWAVVGAVPCAGAAIGLNILARRAMDREPGPSWRLPASTTFAMAGVGLATIWWPGLSGNGKGLVELALAPTQVSPDAGHAAATFALLCVLKILATSLCLRGGIVGGLLTPALATGAALGAAVALGLTAAGLASSAASFGLVAAAGVLSVSHRSALFATVFTWELTHMPWQLALASALCSVLARGVAKAVGRD
ncbi:MAG: chloride channel protein [Terracoccus sp.]